MRQRQKKNWNESLNSWFFKIELTVTFDRLTLIHLIDGIWNIPNVIVTEFTGSKLIFQQKMSEERKSWEVSAGKWPLLN